jgi:glycine betaine/proline transport system ATP-binding protein
MRRSRISMVFQQFALMPWLTVRDNVGFGLDIRALDKAERDRIVDEKIKLVRLDKFADKFPHELSGGMQQRVGLARAFATDAPILLMDEPFSALDPLIRTKLQDELLQLQKTIKKTIIFVSHDLEEALKIGNRITIMESGRIVQSGQPEDIVLKPADAYVQDFIANVNPLSVLTAWNVMRSAHDLEHAGDGWVWLDLRKTTRFKCDSDGKVCEAECNGKPAQWVSCSEIDAPLPDGKAPVYWARPGTNLKTVILAMHRSGVAPVALFDDQDRFVGAIGVRNLLQAILRRGG